MSQTLTLTASQIERIIRQYLLEKKAPYGNLVAPDDLSTYSDDITLSFNPALVDETVTVT